MLIASWPALYAAWTGFSDSAGMASSLHQVAAIFSTSSICVLVGIVGTALALLVGLHSIALMYAAWLWIWHSDREDGK